MIKNLFIVCAIFLVLGCETSKVISGDAALAVYFLSTKAQINDKTSDSSNGVTIDIFLKKNEAIRLEISALLGFQVGSLLMTRTNLQYAVHPQKYFIQGPLAGRTLKPLFKQEIDPQILWSLIHNESLKQRGFQCRKLDSGTELCKNSQATVEIEQRGEIGPGGLSTDGQKKVTLENAKLKMIWIFKSIEALSRDSQNETFVLARPKEYKLITIK
jgi:hypothetical protein